MTADTFWLFVLASAAIVAVPGPTVTVIVANSLTHGVRAGLMNIVGTQIGLALMILALAFGFAFIVERLASLFDVIRFVGAVYLIWLGITLWRANGATLSAANQPGESGTGQGIGKSSDFGADARHMLQGFLVIWSNPKALFFFGAFLPQFVETTRPAAPQVIVLGLIFMAVGTLLDSGWALLAARASQRLERRHARLVERTSATWLAGGGLWLLAAGRSA